MIAIIIPVLEATARPTEERNIGFVLNGDAHHDKEGRGGVVEITVVMTPSLAHTATLNVVKTKEQPE